MPWILELAASAWHSYLRRQRSSVAPHPSPNVNLKSLLLVPLSVLVEVDSAAIASVPVCDSIAAVPIQAARNQWHIIKYVLHRAKIEIRQHFTILIQHGNA